MASSSQGAPAPTKPKLFNDSVHGHFELHPLLCRVIDTPQFQRLRDLRQLGGVSYVFATGNHSRFEHSIGVSFLSTCFIRRLQKQHPELAISEEECLIVGLAGLCHDLGHGMLSHMFGSAFIRGIHGENCEWEHEHASATLLRYLVDSNDLHATFRAHGLDPINDVHTAQELIFGDAHEAPAGWEWRGLSNRRAFLFDIVANKISGVDVDKFDYFMRDSKNLGIPITFDCHRLIKSARVAAVRDEADGRDGSDADLTPTDLDNAPLHICFLEKELWDVHELFHTRYTLHKRAYQHRVARIVEIMLCEAMRSADAVVRIPLCDEAIVARFPVRNAMCDAAYAAAAPPLVKPVGRPICAACVAAQRVASAAVQAQQQQHPYHGGGGPPATCTLSQSIRSMPAYTCTSDWLIKRIEHSVEPALMEARAILRRLRTRQLYPFVADTLLPRETKGAPDHDELRAAITKEAVKIMRLRPRDPHLPFVGETISSTVAATIILDTVKISYGSGGKDPVRSVAFVSKGRPMGMRISESKRASHMTPSIFEERYVRVYVKEKAQRELVKEAWIAVCNAKAWAPPTPSTDRTRGVRARAGAGAAQLRPRAARGGKSAAARSLASSTPPLSTVREEKVTETEVGVEMETGKPKSTQLGKRSRRSSAAAATAGGGGGGGGGGSSGAGRVDGERDAKRS